MNSACRLLPYFTPFQSLYIFKPVFTWLLKYKTHFVKTLERIFRRIRVLYLNRITKTLQSALLGFSVKIQLKEVYAHFRTFFQFQLC